MNEQSNLEQRISEIESRLNSIEHKKNDTSRKRYADISKKKLSNSDTKNILLVVRENIDKMSMIIDDVNNGNSSIATACRDYDFDYIRFLRYCELIANSDVKRFNGRIDPFNIASDIERFYADVFDSEIDEVIKIMPADAEETAEFIISKFSERESDIIHKKYFENMTYAEIGKIYNLTVERIRQIHLKVIRRIRRNYTDVLQIGVSIYSLAESEHESRKRELIKQLSFEFDKKDAEYIQLQFRPNTLVDVPIQELDLSVRAFNCLKRAKIDTTVDLNNLTIEKLASVRNLGRKSIEEVIDKSSKFGVHIFSQDEAEYIKKAAEAEKQKEEEKHE